MKKITFTIIFTFIFCFTVFAQTESNSNCPEIKVSSSSDHVLEGETITFTANINSAEPNKTEYQWSVDNGTIIEGQRTSVIKVDTKGLGDAVVIPAVEIKYLFGNCKNEPLEGVVIIAPPEIHYPLVDEFGKLSKIDEKERLEALVPELRKNTDNIAYFVLYYQPKNGKKNFHDRAARIQQILIKENKISTERIVVVNGGIEREERTRIFLYPAGYDPPTP